MSIVYIFHVLPHNHKSNFMCSLDHPWGTGSMEASKQCPLRCLHFPMTPKDMFMLAVEELCLGPSQQAHNVLRRECHHSSSLGRWVPLQVAVLIRTIVQNNHLCTAPGSILSSTVPVFVPIRSLMISGWTGLSARMDCWKFQVFITLTRLLTIAD